MTKYAMVIDISRCTACYCCFAACKDEHWGNEYLPYSAAQPRYGQFWMNLVKKERGEHPYVKVAYMPLPCMQCSDAPCIKAASNGAVYRRDDGIVVIDPEKAVGQKQLIEACPYGVIFWNDEKSLPQKCTFCVHRLEKGQIPRCVQACPSECIKFGDSDDPESEVSKLLQSAETEVFHPEWATDPGVYYKNLHTVTKHYIAGTVVYGDTDECAGGVKAVLEGNGKPVITTSNDFGDFEFDGFDAGNYTIKLECNGYDPVTIEVTLNTAIYLGNITLVKHKL